MPPSVDPRLDTVQAQLSAAADVMRLALEQCAGSIVAAADVITESFQRGGKLLLCGNGGSAADCQHLATEFTCRLSADFIRPALPALALTTDTSFLTAHTNDFEFETIFSRQVQALGKPEDVVLGISTSGNSGNVIRAVEAARALGAKTVVLTGNRGRLREMADVAICVPSDRTAHIQETHLAIEHIICHLVERALFAGHGESAESSSRHAA